MKRGRGKNKARTNKPQQQEARKSAAPIVIVCDSAWTHETELFASKTQQWQVVVYNPDTQKWWDRLLKSTRARNGPPSQEKACHVVAVFSDNELEPAMDDNDNNNNGEEENTVWKALQQLGERIFIQTVAILVGQEGHPVVGEMQSQVADAVQDDCVQTFLTPQLFANYKDLHQLWTFQDAHDNSTAIVQQLELSQIPLVCNSWSALKWRWNGPLLRDIYQRLCVDEQKGEEEREHEASEKKVLEHVLKDQKLRRDFEGKAAEWLQQADTRRVADLVLSGAHDDVNLFGRLHGWVLFSGSQRRAQKQQQLYLVVKSKSKSKAVLNAYDYATGSHVTNAMEHLQIVDNPTRDEFAIPILRDNAMVTVRLIPALFPNGIPGNDFDSVLGSQRIWLEDMTLKVAIVYLFQGPSGQLWDLCQHVVQNALPKTWDVLLTVQPPEEVLLRALFHPDVVQAGRLALPHSSGSENKKSNSPDEITTQRLIPWYLDVMSRIYALGRFVQTFDEKLRSNIGDNTCEAIASTMKLHPEQVHAVLGRATSGPLTADACAEILQIGNAELPEKSNRKSEMTTQTMEVLGMLGVFLQRDRKSLQDSHRFDDMYDGVSGFQVNGQTYKTTKALADCAMYCGTLKWLSDDNDDEEEGIWTCISCLHRWQKQSSEREAFQVRKLMHPMKLTTFTREEYYDPKDWDDIMQAVNGNINRLGVGFYWGRCSNGACGHKICPGVARDCAETDGVPLRDFPETVRVNNNNDYGNEGDDTLQLRHSLDALGPLGQPNGIVTSSNLEKFFDSAEKLSYLPGRLRRRVRNCIDKSRYILPRGLLCESCTAVPEDAIDEYCPYCGMGFEPIFACVHYSCPRCDKHFCKACLGISGIHYDGVYSSESHVCWKILGNRYSYHNKGLCAKCSKERPWPAEYRLKSAGPKIRSKALNEEVSTEEAIKMQAANLKAFTDRYEEAVEVFKRCDHTRGLGEDYCHCGPDVDQYDDYD